MKHYWFKRWGWCHYPVSWQGWLIMTLATIFLVTVFLAVDRQSESVSGTFYGVFPYYMPVFLFLEWIAEHSTPKT